MNFILLIILINNTEGDYGNHFYKEFNRLHWFGHFANKTHAENYSIFQKRVKRLYDVLESNKSVLFVYTTESFLYHKELRDQEPVHYQALLDLDNFLSSNYPQLNYRILAIHTNTTHQDTGNVSNITFNYPHVSDNGETHRSLFCRNIGNQLQSSLNYGCGDLFCRNTGHQLQKK